MKKVLVILGILILIVAIGVGGYFLFFSKPEPGPQPPVIVSGDDEKTPAEKIIVDTAVTKTEIQRRSVNVNMPFFTNLSNYSFQENINKKIADSITPYINEIAIMADESLPTTTRYKYDVDFERYNNNNYISLVVLQNYSTGGMRSNIWKDTYTVDIVNNEEVTLADICSSVDYKKIIVKEVNKQAEDKKLNLISGNGLSSIPDTQRFYIKDEKLYIYFEPASIAPYLDGEMHFEMPFKFENGQFIVE